VLTTTGLTENLSHSDTGWVDYNYDFVWTGATGPTVISFLDMCNGSMSASGACNGSVGDSNGPPFSLLDNVSLTTVPEPSTWAMLLIGFAGLAYAGYRGRGRAPISIF
jgi:PEP-CTERM motif